MMARKPKAPDIQKPPAQPPTLSELVRLRRPDPGRYGFAPPRAGRSEITEFANMRRPLSGRRANLMIADEVFTVPARPRHEPSCILRPQDQVLSYEVLEAWAKQPSLTASVQPQAVQKTTWVIPDWDALNRALDSSPLEDYCFGDIHFEKSIRDLLRPYQRDYIRWAAQQEPTTIHRTGWWPHQRLAARWIMGIDPSSPTGDRNGVGVYHYAGISLVASDFSDIEARVLALQPLRIPTKLPATRQTYVVDKGVMTINDVSRVVHNLEIKVNRTAGLNLKSMGAAMEKFREKFRENLDRVSTAAITDPGTIARRWGNPKNDIFKALFGGDMSLSAKDFRDTHIMPHLNQYLTDRYDPLGRRNDPYGYGRGGGREPGEFLRHELEGSPDTTYRLLGVSGGSLNFIKRPFASDWESFSAVLEHVIWGPNGEFVGVIVTPEIRNRLDEANRRRGIFVEGQPVGLRRVGGQSQARERPILGFATYEDLAWWKAFHRGDTGGVTQCLSSLIFAGRADPARVADWANVLDQNLDPGIGDAPYAFGFGLLRDEDDHFDALGVLADLNEPDAWVLSEKDDAYAIHGSTTILRGAELRTYLDMPHGDADRDCNAMLLAFRDALTKRSEQEKSFAGTIKILREGISASKRLTAFVNEYCTDDRRALIDPPPPGVTAGRDVFEDLVEGIDGRVYRNRRWY